ncbi:MAG: hypothetical protein U0930_24250 [Pirellulales bacterium]
MIRLGSSLVVLFLAFGVFTTCLLVPPLEAGDANPTTGSSDSSASQPQPGLVASYKISGQTLSTIDPDILFPGFPNSDGSWQKDARLPSSPLEASWSGWLNIAEQGTYRLHFFGQGKFRLLLDGQEVLSVESQQPSWHESGELALSRGPVALLAEYKSSKVASVGLYWSSNLFQLEPVESHLLSCQPT